MSDISGDTIPESLQVTPPTPHERIASALERIAGVLEWQGEGVRDDSPCKSRRPIEVPTSELLAARVLMEIRDSSSRACLL